MDKRPIFFSYSRSDANQFSLKLAKDLKAVGAHVWIDQLDIKGGENYNDAIEKALESSSSVLFVVSEKSINSKYVLTEVYYALEENKTVIPILLYETKLPFRLRGLQYIDFSKDYEKGLKNLLDSLYSDDHRPMRDYSDTGLGDLADVNIDPIRVNFKRKNALKLQVKIGLILLFLITGVMMFLSYSRQHERELLLDSSEEDSTHVPLQSKKEEVDQKSISNSNPAPKTVETITSSKEKHVDNLTQAKQYYSEGKKKLEAYELGDRRYSDARKYFTKAIELNPKLWEAYDERGHLNFVLSDMKAAEEDYSKVINLQPSYKAYVSRAITRQELKNWNGAITDWDEVLRLFTYKPGNYIHSRGGAKEEIGDVAGACADYQRACELRVPYSCEDYQRLCKQQ